MGRGYANTDSSLPIPYKSRYETHEKRLLLEGYACLEVRVNAGRIESARSIRKQEAVKPSFLEKQPQRIIYFKGDTIRDKTTGKRYLIRQINDGAKLVIAPITETLGVADMSSEYDLRRPSGKSLIDFELVEDVWEPSPRHL